MRREMNEHAANLSPFYAGAAMKLRRAAKVDCTVEQYEAHRRAREAYCRRCRKWLPHSSFRAADRPLMSGFCLRCRRMARAKWCTT